MLFNLNSLVLVEKVQLKILKILLMSILNFLVLLKIQDILIKQINWMVVVEGK